MMKNDNTTSNQKVAIVTGASGGIGLGMAKTLLERGYRVVANSRNITKSKTLASSENLLLVDGDIGTKEIAVKVVDAAVQKFGRVDLLVNNAGIFIPKPFTDYTAEDFNNVLSTNLAGFFYVSQEAIVQMRKQKSGHVVNITTSLVDQPIAGVSAGLANLTKGGLQAITKALAIEYASEGIRVNAIAPGIADTPMHTTDSHEFLKKLHPIQRLAEVSEIVDALLYLTAATFVTGQVIYVDGGSHAGKW
jgi:NAD(P)-dependent dehydrogenase (short-subunit alcohol dehydrogenase family)